jgi:hypothetical protein
MGKATTVSDASKGKRRPHRGSGAFIPPLEHYPDSSLQGNERCAGPSARGAFPGHGNSSDGEPCDYGS